MRVLGAAGESSCLEVLLLWRQSSVQVGNIQKSPCAAPRGLGRTKAWPALEPGPASVSRSGQDGQEPCGCLREMRCSSSCCQSWDWWSQGQGSSFWTCLPGESSHGTKCRGHPRWSLGARAAPTHCLVLGECLGTGLHPHNWPLLLPRIPRQQVCRFPWYLPRAAGRIQPEHPAPQGDGGAGLWSGSCHFPALGVRSGRRGRGGGGASWRDAASGLWCLRNPEWSNWAVLVCTGL